MKFSIVTPSFNQCEFLERTLKSVANQSGVDFEHVVFDGGSTDDSVKILSTFGNGIRWVSEKDRGQTDAVNKGIRATTGEVIGWLNSDDIYYPNALKIVEAFFLENPLVDVVYGMADHIDKLDVPFEEYPTEEWDLARLRNNCFICQPALFFRRRLIEKIGYLNENLNYCMDYEYWLRLGIAGARVQYLKCKLAGSRMYSDNKTLGARVEVHDEINSMLRGLFGIVPDKWLLNYGVVKTETEIDRLGNPRLFAVIAGLRSLSAALRWNKKISRSMLLTFSRWACLYK